jgi:hypothetical protein
VALEYDLFLAICFLIVVGERIPPIGSISEVAIINAGTPPSFFSAMLIAQSNIHLEVRLLNTCSRCESLYWLDAMPGAT